MMSKRQRRDPSAETVVLVHGLWMHGVVLEYFARRLAREGFNVSLFSYPTLRRGLGENSEALVRHVRRLGGSSKKPVHFVAHSLGALVVLRMLADQPVFRLGRVVLMGVPWNGCYCAEWLKQWPGGRTLLGRALREWLSAGVPLDQLESFQIGVIAGNRSWGSGWWIPGLPRPNDGVVAVGETYLPVASDRVELPVGHSQMLFSPACVAQAAYFLREGRFFRDPVSS